MQECPGAPQSLLSGLYDQCAFFRYGDTQLSGRVYPLPPSPPGGKQHSTLIIDVQGVTFYIHQYPTI